MWQVNETFDRDYDQGGYEEKIAGLIRRLRIEARERDMKAAAEWGEAVRVLRKEDHYLLVMIDIAEGKIPEARLYSRNASLNRLLTLVAVGFGLFLVCAILLMAILKFKS